MAKNEIPKAYESRDYEDAIYTAWEDSGFFNPDRLPGERAEAFTIMLPPPNVTGTLHLGHAVMLAIEDIMTRFARMRGKRALWLPGTDHAAIATQTKVERLLMEEGYKDPRKELGREEFLARVEAFARESHDTIVNQMKKMGTSVDWSREAFTLDEARSRAVRTAFKRMYDDGLIYRGDRVVNWCPRCQSTLSDDELEYKETTAKLYTFKYDKNFPIAISTTRPETKAGDTAVAVHPEDERYKDLIGTTVEADFLGIPLSIQIVGDEEVQKEFGTGALGVTPAHSKTDAEIAARHNLASKTVINEQGEMNGQAGAFAGMAAPAARKAVVEKLREAGLLEGEEETAQNLSICYRCDTPVEPLPKTQWFIDVNKPFTFRASAHAPIEGLADGQEVTLKSLMQHAVRSGQIEIIPDRFQKTYFHWIDNLRDWNISRQIWYGHQVPVWYKGEEIAVGEAPEGDGWVQDEDTLDTWFSSGLWTISALGWPDDSEDLRIFHPTSVLETGYDILFFWVARMILMTTYAVGEIPFKQVYLHGLVRDEEGRKMSKSLGNVIDPLKMIEQYGADATRLSLVIGATPGNDMKLSEEKVAGYRNFTNKLWNISRFVLMSVDEVRSVETPEPASLADRWILSRFSRLQDDVTAHLERHEFSLAGERLRDFTWNEFADWYLEIAKIERNDAVLLFILERLLIMWHPFMPFVTEEIAKQFPSDDPLMIRSWPEGISAEDDQAEQEFALVREVIVALRNIRAQYQVAPSNRISAAAVSAPHRGLLAEQTEIVKRLARLSDWQVESAGEKPEGAAGAVIEEVQIFVPLAGMIDTEKEKARLLKELDATEDYLDSLNKKLGNADFTQKAPAHVVESLRAKKIDSEKKRATIEEQLLSL